jgi:hypothetical protein
MTIRLIQFRGSLGGGGGGGGIAPTVSGVSPSSGTTGGGTSLTITGANFLGATAVSIGGVPVASFTINSDSQIAAVTGAHGAATVDVVVTNSTGSGTDAASFTYATPSTPVITGVLPSSGDPAGGTSVTISGTNLGSALSVTFGGTLATITANTPSSITVTTPAHAGGTVDVAVTTAAGTGTATGAFTFAAAGATILYRITSPEFSAANPAFEVEMPNSLGNGTVIELQLRTAGASDWSSLVRDVSHTITSTESWHNFATLSFTALSSGSYEARALVNGTPTTNVLTVTV